MREARERERVGSVPEAVECYEAAIGDAERHGEPAVLAESLRRLAVLRHHQSETVVARELCRRSHEVAVAMGNDVLAAEALNTLGGLALQSGELSEARDTFVRALALGGHSRELSARVEQNLGILANIQGDHDGALAHYARSLEAYRSTGDEHGCAIAFHNLGMVSADRGLWDQADHYYAQSFEIAQTTGDLHLRALCLVNRAEVHCALQRYDAARTDAEAALVIFDQMGVRGPKADAYRVIGMVYRETGRPALAESRLRSSIELAVRTHAVLAEAEASRELALLYQGVGRNQEALTFLNAAHRLFHRLDARLDLVHVAHKVAELEATYLAVVRQWGESIESSDSYTFGHCERVASYALRVAQVLGLNEHQQTTIRVGAYLHDLGKVRVPHEILSKPGPLTNDELEVVRMHPIWGIELVASIEFPWDIKPIIRWHHERYDGTGYPDRLKGDECPLAAQIVGIADVYDALTTTRSYRGALSQQQALEEIGRCRTWWRSDVHAALARTLIREEAREKGGSLRPSPAVLD